MTRLAFLTDLHFGYERHELRGALITAVNATQPDLVVCAGDLAHRARRGLLSAGRRLLDELDAPWFVVPGNHDVPLYNVVARMARPFHDYRRILGRDLEFVTLVGDICVIGANTTDPYKWQRGALSHRQIDRICTLAQPEAAAGRRVILAVHHPLEQHPEVDKDLAVNAAEAMARFEDSGVHVVLSGHLHHWYTDYFIDRGDCRVLQVQGGTALCDRTTDLQNEFATLDLEGCNLAVRRYVARGEALTFAPRDPINLTRIDGIWRRR